MPNWCVGTLKVRGEKENIVRFLKEALNFGNPDRKRIIENKYVIVLEVESGYFHIKGSNRNFVMGKEIEYWYGQDILVLDRIEAAWAIDCHALRKLSKEFQLDFKIYSFEKGQCFNHDFEIHKGEVIKDELIEFENYDWECIMPGLGG